MRGSMVPANTKKSLLVMGMFRPLPDLLIAGGGIGITVLLLLIFSNAGVFGILLMCMPMLIGAALVMPIPNYHNTLVAIQSIMRFYQERRKYIWRGWCSKDEYK